MQQLSSPADFDIKDYDFKLKQVDGKFQVRLQNKNNGALLTLKTPYMILPFEPSSYLKSKGSTDNLNDWTIDAKAICYETIDLSKMKDKNNNSIAYDFENNKEQITKLFSIFKEIREKAIDFLVDNCEKIWKKKVKREIIDEAYMSKIIKESDKKDANGNLYPDRITCKIMKGKENVPEIAVEDYEGNLIKIDTWEDIETKLVPLVPKGTPAKMIIQLRTSIVNSKFFITLKLCALQIDDKSKTKVNNIFTFRDFDEKLKIVKDTSTKDTEETTKTVDSEEESDNDSDEGSEVDVEEA
jgi:hypothetical protein